MEKVIYFKYVLVKIILIFILSGHTERCLTQNWIRDSIIVLIDSNKLECPLDSTYFSTSVCDRRWLNASKLLSQYYFLDDTILCGYLENNSSYIINKYRGIHHTLSMGSKNYMKAQLNSYKYSLLLQPLPITVQFDSLLAKNELFLLEHYANTLNMDELIGLILKLIDSESISGIYYGVAKKIKDDDIPTFYQKIIDSIKYDREHYYYLIYRIYTCKTSACDSIFNLEYMRFDSLKNLTNPDDEFLWEDIFNRGEIIRDSIRHAIEWKRQQDRIDSIYHLMYYESITPLTEEEYFATLDSSELLEWKVSHDTTLWYTGNIYSGDDGTNFLLWSNDSLLQKIRSFNLDSLYTLYVNKNPSAMYKVPSMFHLWKATQVIGDRLLNGSMLLQTQDSTFLNNMIQYYADRHCDTVNLFTEMQLEAKAQLLRLWPLLEPHFYNWIETPGYCYRFLAIELMASVFTEEMVLYLINKIDYPANALEQSLKWQYYEVLTVLYGVKDPTLEQFNYTIPPRRSTRTYQQTQDWIDRLIEPMRLRHNLPAH